MLGVAAADAAAPRRRPRDDTLGRRVLPWIGNGVEPVPELGVHVVEMAERASEEEVFADIRKRPLELAFCLGSVSLARLRMESGLIARLS